MATKRHIQDFSSASTLEPHWGYEARVVPCTNDIASCEYLDVVYHSHDLGMYYSAGLWALLLCLVVLLMLHRWINISRWTSSTTLRRFACAFSAAQRKLFLPDVRFLKATRMQVTILSLLCVYLTIFSFVGIKFKTWTTPVKGYPNLTQTRSSIGPFADRIGIMAYALTPLSILLASRESVLSAVTGVPVQYFMFIHIWIGRIIFVQSLVHAIMWSVVEGVLYQPQPKVYKTWIVQQYMIYGIVAMFLVAVLFVLSFSFVIKRTGYEVFRKVHYITAMLYIGMCWGHWHQLWCWMIASLFLWALDRIARGMRLIEGHFGHEDGRTLLGFLPLTGKVQVYRDSKGAVIRLDIIDTRSLSWMPGQHFYVTFPELSLWQSHPFTALSMPDEHCQYDKLSFILRCESGETAKLLRWAETQQAVTIEIRMILSGPYGPTCLDVADQANVLGVAAGTGISYVLPIIANAAINKPQATTKLIWIVREAVDLQWIANELANIRGKPWRVEVEVFVTREAIGQEDGKQASSMITETDTRSLDGITVNALGNNRPHLNRVVEDFIESAASVQAETRVIGSGPKQMMTDLRDAISRCNRPSKIWKKGDQRWNVSFRCDTRQY